MNFSRIYRRFIRSWAVDAVLIVTLIIGFLAFSFRNEVSAFLQWVLDGMDAAITLLDTAEPGEESVLDFFTAKRMLAIAGAAVFLAVVWNRMVWRLRNTRRLTAAVCPKCSHPLSRIRRNRYHKALSTVLPIRRYYCHNCQWKGLRIKSYQSEDNAVEIKLRSGTRSLGSV